MLGGRGLPRISEAALGRGEGPHILAAEHHRPGKPSSSLFFLASGLWSEGLRLLSKGARACFSRCRQPLEHCLRHTGKLGWSPAKPSLLAAGAAPPALESSGSFLPPGDTFPGDAWESLAQVSLAEATRCGLAGAPPEEASLQGPLHCGWVP